MASLVNFSYADYLASIRNSYRNLHYCRKCQSFRCNLRKHRKKIRIVISGNSSNLVLLPGHCSSYAKGVDICDYTKFATEICEWHHSAIDLILYEAIASIHSVIESNLCEAIDLSRRSTVVFTLYTNKLHKIKVVTAITRVDLTSDWFGIGMAATMSPDNDPKYFDTRNYSFTNSGAVSVDLNRIGGLFYLMRTYLKTNGYAKCEKCGRHHENKCENCVHVNSCKYCIRQRPCKNCVTHSTICEGCVYIKGCKDRQVFYNVSDDSGLRSTKPKSS